MTSIEVVWVWALLTALCLVICTVVLRAACLAANGVNRVTDQGPPIPMPDYLEATVNVLVAAIMFALVRRAFFEVGLHENEVLLRIASTIATLVFAFLIAVHLPWQRGTRRSLPVLASCFYVILLMSIGVAGRELVALVA